MNRRHFLATSLAAALTSIPAVAAGQRRFDLLAIATAGGATPCGACRQVLAEFALDLPILLVDINQPHLVQETNLRDLLPHAFRL